MNGIDMKGETRRFIIMLVLFLSFYTTLATFVLSSAA